MQLTDDKVTNDERIRRLPTLESQLAAWIYAVDQNLASRNLTLRRAGFQVYVRRSHRKLEGAYLTTLDIATANVPERYRGRGWFRSFRQIAEALNPWDATYYEAVHNPRLAAHFSSEGLASDGELCFYAVHVRRTAVSHAAL